MSIAALALERGTTSEALALAIGVSPLLFTRIDQGRQGLPVDLVPAMAALLGVAVGTVEQAAFLLLRSNNPTGRIPRPPRLELGDSF